MIKIFQDRIIDRYFNTLDYIIDREGVSKGEGFSILTIECSIIEFLAATINGMLFRYDTTNTKNYYYTESSKWYNKFLNDASIFEGYFYGEGCFLKAHEFYKDVRCALIHEAQTKNGWTVAIYQKDKSKDKSNKIIFEGKVIYRTALNTALREYFLKFCDDAKEETPKGKRFRKFIARRLDVISEIEPDTNFWGCNSKLRGNKIIFDATW